MRLELGSRVTCTDGPVGDLVDVVVDPVVGRVTHLVVEPQHAPWTARLVPVELAERNTGAGPEIALRATVDEVRRLPPVHEVTYVRLDGFPADDPDWDIGVEEALALPHYPAYDLQPTPPDWGARHDRVPEGEVEIGRTSAVESADGHRLGDVDGFLVDGDGRITHVVLERGHGWRRREVTIPIAAVADLGTDTVTTCLTRDEVAALPEERVQRRPPPRPPATTI